MNSHEPDPRLLRRAMLDVVENQMQANDPPETGETIERLVHDGHSRREAKRLVAMVVAVEVCRIMKDNKEFDRKRYVWNLNHLPAEPWGEDGNLLYPG